MSRGSWAVVPKPRNVLVRSTAQLRPRRLTTQRSRLTTHDSRLVDVEHHALALLRQAGHQIAQVAVVGHHVVDAHAVALPVAGVDRFAIEPGDVDPTRDFLR